MAITADQISAQVAGSIRALEKLPAKEREAKPSKSFVHNFNNLLELAKESMPEVDSRRWPTVISGTPQLGMAQSSQEIRFTEIHVFLEQIQAILGEGLSYS